MNALSVAIKDWLVTAGIGQFASSSDWGIYIGVEPDAPACCVTLFDTPGATGTVELDRSIPVDQSRIQVRVRSLGYVGGRTKMKAILTALEAKVNTEQAEGGDDVWYAAVIPLASGMTYLGRDGKQRHLFTWNFQVRRWTV